MKNIKDLGEKTAIQCKTQEEWDFVTKELNKVWANGHWDRYEDQTCITAVGNSTAKVYFYTHEEYTIVQASDFMPLSPQDEIKELKERIATLEETLRPKKKIEFVKYLGTMEEGLGKSAFTPSQYEFIELIMTYEDYDIMKAYNSESGNVFIYLGHFNDGIK